MGAVIGLKPDAIAAVLSQNGLPGIDIANFNTPSQTVVSGPVDDIKRAGPFFEKAGAQMYVPLQVSPPSTPDTWPKRRKPSPTSWPRCRSSRRRSP
jgi:malonyl CoA-acyl carrier protein transacylase